jgi:hypothetical protein
MQFTVSVVNVDIKLSLTIAILSPRLPLHVRIRTPVKRQIGHDGLMPYGGIWNSARNHWRPSLATAGAIRVDSHRGCGFHVKVKS